MDELKRDFVSTEVRDFRFKLGHLIASSLSGFLAGFIVASIMWAALISLLRGI